MFELRLPFVAFQIAGLLLATTIVYSCANQPAQKKGTQESIHPDSKFQEQIEQTIKSFSGKDCDVIQQEIKELKNLANRDYVKLVRQVVFYAGTQKDGERIVLKARPT